MYCWLEEISSCLLPDRTSGRMHVVFAIEHTTLKAETETTHRHYLFYGQDISEQSWCPAAHTAPGAVTNSAVPEKQNGNEILIRASINCAEFERSVLLHLHLHPPLHHLGCCCLPGSGPFPRISRHPNSVFWSKRPAPSLIYIF